MSNTPKYDAKVKEILDGLTPGERECSMTGQKWNMTDEEISWYKKFNVPPPKVSPRTRWLHHGYWYVGYQFWYQKHPETGKPVICTVHPATGIKVLPDVEWFEKDFIDTGRDYDVSQPFFEQWRELQLSVPMPATRNNIPPKNSIVFVSRGDEDSYFVGASKSRRCIYSHISTDIEDSAEVYLSSNVQNSFNVVHSYRIHNSYYVRDSRDCMNSNFLFDCRNCEFCFGATNKRNKKYLWFNEQLTQEEWEKRKAEVDLGSRQELDKYVRQFQVLIGEQGIWPENFNERCTDVSGEYLTGSTRVVDTYMADEGCLDLYSCNITTGNSERCAFAGYPVWSTEVFYSGTAVYSSNIKYGFLNIHCDNNEYCLLCYNCENCFGCVGLQRKKFCIFNKEYPEDEYWRRVDELKCAMLDRGEYGEFFPIKYSPSYHAESGSPTWFHSTPEEAKQLGALDYDPESEGAIGKDLVDASKLRKLSELPDHVNDLSDDWIGVPLLDETANRRFAMIKPEVEFYRRMKVAPPKKHFIKRMEDLFFEANQGKFEQTKCVSCSKDITVAYNAGHTSRKIYCNDCYIKYLEQNG